MHSVSQKIVFIESVFGGGEVRRENITVRCPFCNDDRAEKKKLSIRLTDDVYHCWVCGVSGKSLAYLLKNFAPEKLEEYRIINPFAGKEGPVEIVDAPLALPPDFRLLAISNDPTANKLKAYLTRRGIGIRDLWRWKIGYSRQEKWRDRVIIPSYDRNGDLNYYTGRIITDQRYRKYENSDVKRIEIVFDEMSIDWKKELVLVEGPFDLMKCRMNSTCLLGSSIASDSLLYAKILYHRTPIVLMLDSDMRSKMIDISKKLISYGINVRCAFLDEGTDPGSMNPADVEKKVSEAVKMDEYAIMRAKLEMTSSLGSNLLAPEIQGP